MTNRSHLVQFGLFTILVLAKLSNSHTCFLFKQQHKAISRQLVVKGTTILAGRGHRSLELEAGSQLLETIRDIRSAARTRHKGDLSVGHSLFHIVHLDKRNDHSISHTLTHVCSGTGQVGQQAPGNPLLAIKSHLIAKSRVVKRITFPPTRANTPHAQPKFMSD